MRLSSLYRESVETFHFPKLPAGRTTDDAGRSAPYIRNAVILFRGMAYRLTLGDTIVNVSQGRSGYLSFLGQDRMEFESEI